MTGAWRGRLATVVAAAVVAAVPVLGAGTPAAADGTVRCTYTILASWPTGFMANLDIANTGSTIDGWTARWTFADPTTGIQGWSALISQQGSEVTAVNAAWNGRIATGAHVDFGWSAVATNTSVPTDITVNGVRC